MFFNELGCYQCRRRDCRILAVLITLLYLAVQLKIGNKQRELDALRHNWDGLNRMCELFGESTEKASIVKRGRESI